MILLFMCKLVDLVVFSCILTISANIIIEKVDTNKTTSIEDRNEQDIGESRIEGNACILKDLTCKGIPIAHKYYWGLSI